MASCLPSRPPPPSKCRRLPPSPRRPRRRAPRPACPVQPARLPRQSRGPGGRGLGEGPVFQQPHRRCARLLRPAHRQARADRQHRQRDEHAQLRHLQVRAPRGGGAHHRDRPQPQRLHRHPGRRPTSSRSSAPARTRARSASRSSPTRPTCPRRTGRLLPAAPALPRPHRDRRRAPAVHPAGQHVPNFTALEKAGALIITDDATTVRRLVDLVASLDQPFAPVTEKWIRLERADATKAIEFLNSVFDSKSASSGSSGARPARRAATTSQPNTDAGPSAAPTKTNPSPNENPGVQTVQQRRQRADHPERRFHHPGPHHPDGRRAHQPRARRHQPGEHDHRRAPPGGIRRRHAFRPARSPAAEVRQRHRRAAHPRAGAQPNPARTTERQLPPARAAPPARPATAARPAPPAPA